LEAVHDVSVKVGCVEVPAHFFGYRRDRPDMILGRPWKKRVRAKSDD
jgi:hypothetical protein